MKRILSSRTFRIAAAGALAVGGTIYVKQEIIGQKGAAQFENITPLLFADITPLLFAEITPLLFADITPLLFADITSLLFADITPLLFADIVFPRTEQTLLTSLYCRFIRLRTYFSLGYVAARNKMLVKQHKEATGTLLSIRADPERVRTNPFSRIQMQRRRE
tara:strand:- start:35 stop:523 length:489 start_codon:yes stop_codon:yes gene_type:complete